MIPKECKRLAEVDFPIAVVSKHAVREKSIRHGHPSTLHLWWARRPLAACRAMLLGLLLPDPCDPYCPTAFKAPAREALQELLGVREGDDGLRRALITFIGDVANWDVANHPRWIAVARELVRAAHDDEPPLVVDPFAGGGSIPLEALRLGCDTVASDLNPVACLILKTVLEDIPRYGVDLAEELRRVGAEIKQAAEKELAGFFPLDSDGTTPIAYLWARTVRCEAPSCGAEIPLVRSFWLADKELWRRVKRRHVRVRGKRGLRYFVERSKDSQPCVKFEVFEPGSDRDVPKGTITRARATCLCCGAVLPPERVRAQLAGQRGGADVVFNARGQRVSGARLMAVVISGADEQGRHYRLPMERDYEAVFKAVKRLREMTSVTLPGGLSSVPDEPLPPVGTLGFRVQRYGMLQWGDIFTARQKITLLEHAQITSNVIRSHTQRSGIALTILAAAISKLADTNSVICTWQINPPRLRATFARQALPMTWDFAEASPLGEGAGNYELCVKAINEVLERLPYNMLATAEQGDATQSPLPSDSVDVWFTDPPYYDAVPYADLSDFFFVWLKRTLSGHPLLRNPSDPTNPLTPKTSEIVQDEVKQVNGRPKDRSFFEEAMAQAFAEGRRILSDSGIGCVIFAHKTTEGWEALLSGMIRGGWVLTGSWPIATELESRQRARDSAALATSVHLVCRPRSEDAPVGDWGEVLRELPSRVGDWIERLQLEGVRGADLVFACIGPALELYSRYSKVVDAEERVIPLGGDPEAVEPHRRGYLAYVWETVARTALEQVLGTAEASARNGLSGALEEDARLTALFLWTLQSTNAEATNGDADESDEEVSEEEDDEEEAPRRRQKGFSLIFDVVRRFSQPLGISLPDWEGRIIETKKGVVRLLSVAERSGQLFGEDGAEAIADQLERSAVGAVQLALFPESTAGAAPAIRSRGLRTKRGADVADEALRTRREATTLDRVHAAMLLQAGGRANALRTLLKAEQDRGPEFLRLANALSALYPKGSEEKRLLDAMLLAGPR